ncbi:E3 ubiquitin-protein ligase TRIM21-like [Mugil cephalus]|uniref:E3 ubiquitin-protein ligase TRIM21-like n=1 Tax=Mugil cephalus TaxID=48193 RepID=UPI001FB691F5|nr:E3 ubiquitin-protein ligase TRIM21-like [Mugil cephalus]XP_047431152.1 E3 ubiquitin-protein ligase TRIM21-like [Mugil cephalus]XP_047431153.1 E3 ubiquitin-protein ligase TRIM21-like [Mugil cephalus]
MTTPREELWETLQDLDKEEFKQFKWFLKDRDIDDASLAIPVSKLDGTDRQDTVDLMVQHYGSSGAREKTVMILKKIRRNDLVQRLSETNSNLRNVDSVSLSIEHKRKKAKLEQVQAEIKLIIVDMEKTIGEIKHSVELSRKSAERQVADAVRVFEALLRSVEKSQTNLVNVIKETQKKTQQEAEGYVRELEKEISKLNKRSAEVEQLYSSKNHDDFVHRFSSLSVTPPVKRWTETVVHQPTYTTSIMTTVKQLKEELCKKTDMFLKREFEVDVTLDPNTANPHLILSGDGKQVHCGKERQNVPDNPQRFDRAINVLGKQSFSSGRFYYEVQVKGKTSWDLGVAKESVSRKGPITASPKNGFWTIGLRKDGKFQANGVYLDVKSHPEKVGVFVDYEYASVFFYDVDSAELLHRLTECSFTEKLHPFFSPGVHNDGRNSAPLVISSPQ